MLQRRLLFGEVTVAASQPMCVVTYISHFQVDSKQRISVRNLRIREDTAKYLRNLDPNSAYYDPKTRSMRDNPYKNTGKAPEDVDFAGE